MILIIAYITLAMVPVGAGLIHAYRLHKHKTRLQDRRNRRVLDRMERRNRR